MTEPLRARRTRFDLSATPNEWIPGDLQTTHLIDSLHVVLPPGERWFGDVLRDALPLITDPKLKDDVRGFIGQEGTHAKAHDLGLAHLQGHGIDLTREVAFADRVRTRMRQRIHRLPAWAQRRIRRHELGAIATIEHFTAVLGVWIVDRPQFDELGVDAQMLDLLRWHGAEEVEHRSVAFDVYQHLDGSYPWRVVHGLIGSVGITLGLFAVGLRIHRLDPAAGRWSYRAYKEAVRAGRMPDMLRVAASIREYVQRDYHPSHYGIDQVPAALAYLDVSPGVVPRSAAS
jgi:predicted metal-dependent hydrolase